MEENKTEQEETIIGVPGITHTSTAGEKTVISGRSNENAWKLERIPNETLEDYHKHQKLMKKSIKAYLRGRFIKQGE